MCVFLSFSGLYINYWIFLFSMEEFMKGRGIQQSVIENMQKDGVSIFFHLEQSGF